MTFSSLFIKSFCLLAFGQAKIFFRYCILMNIFVYILFYDKKNLLTMFHTENNFKIREEHLLIKCHFNKVLSYLLYCKDWYNLIKSRCS